MYTALLIFFHRRINDLDPSLLQREVEAVRDFLERVKVDEAGLGGENMATLIWPAFIAACEAVHSETQMFFSAWFESCFAMTGLVNASVARQIIGTIWVKREESGLDGEMCNWPDILRAKNIRLMCT
jgi:arginine metabolism regulation protein II